MNKSGLPAGKPDRSAADNKVQSIPINGDIEEAIVFTNVEVFIQKLFQQDPKKGFEILFRKYYALMCNHAVRFVYSQQIAEDIVAEIFISFWNNRLYENIKTSYKAYLFTSVRNKCLTYIKHEMGKTDSTQISEGTHESSLATPEQILEASDMHIRIEHTVKGMPDRTQRIFVLSRFDGKKNQEIAAELDISIKTVESHITRALNILKKIFNTRS